MRISRTGTFAGGVVCALVIGGGTAVASNGDPLTVGHSNTGTSVSGLANSKGTPLALSAKKGSPPLDVNSTVKVKNLNSDLLDGLSADNFLPAGGTAADSARLAGQPPSAFLAAGGTADDSARLGGQPPTAYLAAGATAADSARLGGQPASSYLDSVYVTSTSDEAETLLYPHSIIDTMALPAGTYSIAFTAQLANKDTAESAFICELHYSAASGIYFGPEGAATVAPSTGTNEISYGSAAVNEVITVPAVTISVDCFTHSGDTAHTDVVYNSSLTATRVQDLHGTADVFTPQLEEELAR